MNDSAQVLGTVAGLHRYPVKSMLGEDLSELTVTGAGVDGDRALALLDLATGHVATAKHPRLWRRLLRYHAAGTGDDVRITLPDGTPVDASDERIDRILSGELAREVRLCASRPDGAEVERPAPEDVLEHGVGAEVPVQLLEIAQGTTGTNFVDYGPVHLIGTATLNQVSTEPMRYRPNIVLDTGSAPPYAENEWVGREITVGEARLRAILPTPRCAVPTLEHGDLPRAPHAVRTLLEGNRVDVPGFGVLPCAGVYLEVVAGGRILAGDTATLH